MSWEGLDLDPVRIYRAQLRRVPVVDVVQVDARTTLAELRICLWPLGRGPEVQLGRLLPALVTEVEVDDDMVLRWDDVVFLARVNIGEHSSHVVPPLKRRTLLGRVLGLAVPVDIVEVRTRLPDLEVKFRLRGICQLLLSKKVVTKPRVETPVSLAAEHDTILEALVICLELLAELVPRQDALVDTSVLAVDLVHVVCTLKLDPRLN